MIKKLIVLLPVIFLGCNQNAKSEDQDTYNEIVLDDKQEAFINSNSQTIKERFNPEDGFQRESYSSEEFGYFLQHLPLKEINAKVLYYDGNEKSIDNVYNSVIDLPIGTKDLHQCADATMRLRADYLYQQNRYNEIAFNFLSDGKPRDYLTYANGDFSTEKYWQYLEHIFNYANTASLKNQLRTVSYNEVKIGDILIQKGNPYGHAVIVVDLITDGTTKKVLLAQSYMPAQELQILVNPLNENGSPWYEVKEGEIITPEWRFTSNDWKTWE